MKKYRVYGVTRTTGAPVDRTIDADNELGARAWAQESGVVVEGIHEVVPPPRRRESVEAQAPTRPERPSPKLRPARVIVEPSPALFLCNLGAVVLGIPLGLLLTLVCIIGLGAGGAAAIHEATTPPTITRRPPPPSAAPIAWRRIHVGHELASGATLLSARASPYGERIGWRAVYAAGGTEGDRVTVRATLFDAHGNVIHVTGSEQERIDADGGTILGFCNLIKADADAIHRVEIECAE